VSDPAPAVVVVPSGWAQAAAGELCEKIQDGTHFSPKVQLSEGAYPYVTAKNVRPRGLDLSDVSYLREEDHKEIYRRCDARHGDVLLVKDGVNTGDAAINTIRGEISLLSSVCMLRPDKDLVIPEFLRYYLQSPQGSGWLTGRMTGTAIRRIVLRRIKETPVVFPHPQEQRRLVAELEAHLSRLDEAVADLGRVNRNLARYRASVLQAACEGRLVPTEVELARAEGRSFEPASEMLERTEGERPAEGNARRSGDDPGASGPVGSDRELPEGWAWATLNAIAKLKGGLTKGQKRRPGERTRPVPYLRVANVQRGFLDLRELKTIEATNAEIEELQLRPGDVLFNEGGDRDKLGRGWVWEGQIAECIHQNHVFRARIIDGAIKPKLLSWYGNSIGQQYFVTEGKQTTNLASINLTKLGSLPVPIPPTAEQVRIVAEVERRLSLADQVAATVDAALSHAERLRQSILKRAFEGKLVPQDPNDEPASVLLERIRKEREVAAQAQSGSGSASVRPAKRRGKRATPGKSR